MSKIASPQFASQGVGSSLQDEITNAEWDVSTAERVITPRKGLAKNRSTLSRLLSTFQRFIGDHSDLNFCLYIRWAAILVCRTHASVQKELQVIRVLWYPMCVRNSAEYNIWYEVYTAYDMISERTSALHVIAIDGKHLTLPYQANKWLLHYLLITTACCCFIRICHIIWCFTQQLVSTGSLYNDTVDSYTSKQPAIILLYYLGWRLAESRSPWICTTVGHGTKPLIQLYLCVENALQVLHNSSLLFLFWCKSGTISRRLISLDWSANNQRITTVLLVVVSLQEKMK